MNKLTVAITTFQKRLPLVKQLITNIRKSCDNDIVLVVNADNEKNMDESYRQDLLLFCSNIPNCYPICCPEFKSLPKMWNTAVIFSKTEHILLLNDDVEYTNPNAISDIEGVINNHGINCFRINFSYSHFVISKTILHTIGYFDERLCAHGEEDGDFVLRYIEYYGKQVPDITISGIINTAAYDLVGGDFETHDGNKPKFNREFILTKWIDDPAGIKGMGVSPVKRAIDDYQQYPYEMFVRNNKHNISKFQTITMSYE